MASNFDFLATWWPDLAQLGQLAEVSLHTDAGLCTDKIGLLAERIAAWMCLFEKAELPEQASHGDKLRWLKRAELLPGGMSDVFYALRKGRGDAVHMSMASQERAVRLLELGFYASCWFVKVYVQPEFAVPQYTQPEQAENAGEQIEALEEALRQQVAGEPVEIVQLSRQARKERAAQAAAELPLPAPEETAAESVRMDVSVLPVINYAMQQNGAVAIREITIENRSETPLENLELRITTAPGFAMPFTRHIDLVPPGKSVTISKPQLILNGDYLAQMTEKVTGLVHVALRRDGKTLVFDNAETTVLAFDEWHGLGIYPEMLAAFVTPNHPALARIIARATEFLGKWTGDTSMDAYQSQDPNRVVSQAAAIFTAIKEQAIAYVVPPASFERVGQRVRLCDTVLQQKLGTCLDLTLLYASCLEAVGLHPILITTPGHIFTGVWLEESMFPECVQDDGSLISKRLASGVNEIAVMETTCVTTGADRSFDDARVAGERNIATKEVDYIIDIHRARMSRISPLPQRVSTDSGYEIVHDATFRKEKMNAPTRLDDTVHVESGVPEEQLPKKIQWERKLLDLGMRNTLINLRLTKSLLPVLTGSLDELENALADGSDFSVMARPADLRMEEFSFEGLLEMSKNEIVQAEFANKRLRSALTEGELAKTVKELYRTAKAALEENGANTLYLALGMLRWYENKRSTRARYAPVILIPIEIIRKSAAQGYVIRLRDEEPQMNITLLEKLKQDFGIVVSGLDPLPADEHGTDIRKVLTVMRKAVMEQPHWDVLEAAGIGIFSFSQFVMWNDIRNRTEDLLRNKVVRSLMEGKLCWDAQPLQIGEKVEENNVLLPMPADASQLYAIRSACNGESFVLHGPPGTGKSQTITSLIANALASGKRVLFVAEKMAALEVVQKRLERIGIGPFCLELHSNKSKKRDVLEQLRQATEVTKTVSAKEFASKAQRLADMRAELDVYARQLHEIRNCGSDLYTLINAYEQCRDARELETFNAAWLKELTAEDLEQQLLVVERMVTAAREVGHPHNHPLSRVRCTQYTQSLRGSLRGAVDAYTLQLQRMQGFVAQLAASLGQAEPKDAQALHGLGQIATQMACWYEMPAAWAKTTFPQMYFDEVAAMAAHAQNANCLEQQLLQTFDPGFLSQNGQQLLNEYMQTNAKWFLAKAMGMNQLTKTVNAYARTPVSKEQLQPHLTALRDYQQEQQAMGALLNKYGGDLGMLYAGKATNWGHIAHLAAKAKESANALYRFTGSYDVMNRCCGVAQLREAVIGVSQGMPAFDQAETAFEDMLGIVPAQAEKYLDDQLALCRTILLHADSLKEWIAYTGAAQQAQEMGLGNVVRFYEGGAAHEEVEPAYRKAVLFGLICVAIDESSDLNQFSGAVFNKKIEQYKRMDQEWATLSQQEVYCRLASKVPDFTREAAQSSELGILQRCIKSGGRGTSIRRLFDQIPNLLPRLCPCMLMSPISAAQYLDPKRAPFDIVVFDEASQLPTCKAVGVLARGKDAIIVGDPKQMPPTSFFATNTVDEDNLEVEDLESILDDCLALNMPQSHLLWHYRSRHESLIAFSNSQFYENKLYTFPSVNDRETKVRLVPVEGVFDRGKTRTNKAEAQAVVEEIKRRAKDPEASKLSVGVVTFNISQQHLIDDLLNEACAQDPELEKWVYREDEPVFIKNLENVQGDERDVILFSIGFGPDENGKLYMNFGPLNRDGGWRRLNVAVSRSRCEMVVFSTLRAEQLDLNRTQAEGVAALRSFLEYAEGRAMAVEETVSQDPAGQCRGVAEAICRLLAQNGYETDLSVGRSAYRIDIAVIYPEEPEKYLLGIMLDGPGYGNAKTTRDREVAQIGVLQGLGWHITRVWSMDWWDNCDKEMQRILKQLKAIRKEKAAPPARPEEPTQPEQPKEELPVEVVPAPVLAEQPKVKAAEPVVKTPPVYKAAELQLKQLTAEEFIEPRHARSIQSRIKSVLQAEAPISMGLMTKRVLQSFGISRAGTRIQNHMSALTGKVEMKITRQGQTEFCWKPEQEPEAYVGLRINGEGEHKRDVRDLPVQEVANAVYLVLDEQISMSREDLLRETANRLGYTRLGSNVLSVLALGLDYAQGQGGITEGENGNFVLSEGGSARAATVRKNF